MNNISFVFMMLESSSCEGALAGWQRRTRAKYFKTAHLGRSMLKLVTDTQLLAYKPADLWDYCPICIHQVGYGGITMRRYLTPK